MWIQTNIDREESLFTAQPFIHGPYRFVNRVLQRTLPNDSHTPAEVTKHGDVAFVSVDVSLEFLLPEICICLRKGSVSTAFMPVPKTAVNEYYSLVFREHEIGRAW